MIGEGWMGKKRASNRILGTLLLGLLTLSVSLGGQPGANHAGAAAKPGIPSGIGANQPPSPQNEGLVFRVYFRDNAERDRLAQQLGAEESSTMGGYLMVWSDNNRYESLKKQGLR